MPSGVAAWAGDHADYLCVVRELARDMKRPVFIGEFGLASKDDETAHALQVREAPLRYGARLM